MRPETLALDPQGSFGATVLIVELLGAEVHVIAEVDDGTRIVIRQEVASTRPRIGERISVRTEEESLTLFDVGTTRRIEALG
jgi:hypothetical protein